MADGGSLDGLHYLIRHGKSDGLLAKVKVIGRAKAVRTVFTFAAYKLTRMATIFGWRLNMI